MSSELRFKSVLNPSKWGYLYTGDTMSFWEQAYRSAGALGGAMGYFETLGDGFTQHSPTTVADKRHFTDYCISLATFLQANHDAKFSTYAFDDCTNAETIRFLATIQYRDEKRQYFNLVERKVSTAQRLQYDKRWQLVPTWANADMESAYGLFRLGSERHLYFFEMYAAHQLFWDNLYDRVHGDWDKVTKYHDELAGDHRSAFRALKLTIDSRSQLDSAKRVLECAVSNSTPKTEEVA